MLIKKSNFVREIIDIRRVSSVVNQFIKHTIVLSYGAKLTSLILKNHIRMISHSGPELTEDRSITDASMERSVQWKTVQYTRGYVIYVFKKRENDEIKSLDYHHFYLHGFLVDNRPTMHIIVHL